MVDKFYNYRHWKLGVELDLSELKNLLEEMEESDLFIKDIVKVKNQIRLMED